MKAKLLFVAAVALLAAVGAHAEMYQGVQAPVSALNRSDVHAQAVAAAARPDQNVVRGSRGEAVVSTADRNAVYREAVRTASRPDWNVVGGSRVNSQVVSTMRNPVDAAGEKQGSKL